MVKPMKKAKQSIHLKTKKKNNIKNTKLLYDEQPLTRREKEILKFNSELKKSNNLKFKRKKILNRVLEESAKLGYQQMPWEDTDQLVRRIAKDKTKDVEANLLKAKFGTAGRDIKEIAQEYKELDEKKQRRKQQKKNEYENRMKKAKKFVKKKRTMEIENNNLVPDNNVIEQKNLSNANTLSKKKSSKKDTRRLKQKETKIAEEKELLLNAREIIPFGERVDRPPEFTGKFRDSINRSRAKAGSMNLIFKSQLNFKPDIVKTEEKLNNNEKEIGLTLERDRVIEMYRAKKIPN